ncbi:MAG: DUF3551 domain-containing protein [Xanthobacteraceae bacterium]
MHANHSRNCTLVRLGRAGGGRAAFGRGRNLSAWCAQYYGFGGGGTNCGFISYEQCMMTAQGAGAWCVQNPWYLAYGDGSQKAAATARRTRNRR